MCRPVVLFSNPDKAHLRAEVGSVPDVGEEGVRVTGSAERHAGPVHHRVVMDVLRQDPAPLEENPAAANQNR